MAMTEVIINEIDAGISHTNELLNQIALDKQIKEKDKVELSVLLNEVVLFTFLRLRQVIIADDAENPNFIRPYSAALIIYGQVYGKVNKIKEKSELMRQCAFKGLAKDPKQLAKKDIESDCLKVKDKLKRGGFRAVFARELHVKYPIFTDIDTIKGYISEFMEANELTPKK